VGGPFAFELTRPRERALAIAPIVDLRGVRLVFEPREDEHTDKSKGKDDDDRAERDRHAREPERREAAGARLASLLVRDDARAWTQPVAVTCSESFVNTYAFDTGPNLARTRLDSLGQGEPPD